MMTMTAVSTMATTGSYSSSAICLRLQGEIFGQLLLDLHVLAALVHARDGEVITELPLRDPLVAQRDGDVAEVREPAAAGNETTGQRRHTCCSRQTQHLTQFSPMRSSSAPM